MKTSLTTALLPARIGGDKSQCGVADAKGLSTLAIASSKRPQFCCGAPAMKGDHVYPSMKGFP